MATSPPEPVPASPPEAFSVAVEDSDAADWNDRVFEPDVFAKWDTLAREPRYGWRPTTLQED